MRGGPAPLHADERMAVSRPFDGMVRCLQLYKEIGMPIFKLTCHVTVSAFTNVEADSLELAIEEAADRSVEIHFNGSGTSPDEVWCIECADGSPEHVHADA